MKAKSCGLAGRKEKLRKLIRDAAGSGNVLVALSGGSDSALMVTEAAAELGSERVVAVTAVSPVTVDRDETAARDLCVRLHVRHEVVQSLEFADPAFTSNSADRCYFCKLSRYKQLKVMAEDLGALVIFDGTQADDNPATRPGTRAVKELGILTPLADAGIGKKDVRKLLKEAGLEEIADRPSESCLATRIPEGTSITKAALERIRRCEDYLHSIGMAVVRVRDHHPIARIVTDKSGMKLLSGNKDMRKEVVRRFREASYEFVAVDLSFYGEK